VSAGASDVARSTWARRTASLALVFAAAKLTLLAVRAVDGTARGLASAWAPLALVYLDVWVVLAWGALDLALVRLARGRRWAQAWGGIAWGLYALAVAYSALNVPVARVFSTPLTFPILSATGGALADSIAVYVTPLNLGSAALVLAAGAAFPRALRRPPAPRARPLRLVAALAAAVSLLVGPTAAAHVDTLGLHRNPLLTLAATTLAQRRAATGATGATGDHAPAAPPLVPDPASPARDLSHLAGAARGRNVVWIILESTGAEYLAPYGAARDPMPRTTALAGRGVVFDSVYAAYPESIKGLYSVLCSSWPAAHTDADRYTAARIPCGPVAERFAGAGYHTALYHSGRFAYLGMRGVVERRGFERLADAGDVGGRFASSFGTDEPSTVRSALAWIDGLGRGERFFLMYLPIAGHHPYHSPGDGPRPFGEGSERDAYASDLWRADHAVGELLDGLRARGLDRDTLFVVHGDHGEAFFQHEGNFAHTLFAYEENLHVPLYLMAPGVPGLDGGGGHAPQVGSLVDVAPTVLALAGLDPPARWQGRSLLSPAPGVARFFVDQATWQVGLRDGPWKLIHDVETGRSRLFRLDRDPGERTNLAAAEPERVARYRDHLAAWAARQRALVVGEGRSR
jgi:hypothetical protein